MIRLASALHGLLYGRLKLAGLLLCGICLLAGTVRAGDAIEPRLQIGVNLLPAIVAANKAVINSPAEAELPIYLVYESNPHLAEQLLSRLTQLGAIRDRRLIISTVSLDSLLTQETGPTSSIFIVEPLAGRLTELIEHAKENRSLLFSPFQGDVEDGVNSGFQVTDKVLPMVNMPSLKASKIQLKAFFLRIAVKHE